MEDDQVKPECHYFWEELKLPHILYLLSICFSVQKHKSFTSNKDIL